ncbi:MAG: glycosyltransferase family 4 protein [Alkalispirochaeta sp.]
MTNRTFSGRRFTIVGIFPIAEVRTGGHRRFIELARQLADRGHRVIIVCRPMLADRLPGEALPIIPDSITSYVPPRWWQYRRYVRRYRGELRAAVGEGATSRDAAVNETVVLTFGETNYPAARAAGDLLGVPVVFALRSNFVDEFLRFGTFRRRIAVVPGLQKRFQRWWKQRLERAFCRGSDLLVFQTEYDRDNVAARNPGIETRSLVIPNSFRVEWLPASVARPVTVPDAESEATATRWVYLGHLNERKGVQFLFPALRMLRDHGFSDFHLDVVGFGGLENWARDYVSTHGLGQQVTFHGRNDQPLMLLQRAHLSIVPSIYDSFPNTVLESLFVGTPVIGADAAGIRTMLHHSELLFSAGSAEALADRLQQVARDPAAWRQVCVRSAERRATFDFDWAACWETALARVVG